MSKFPLHMPRQKFKSKGSNAEMIMILIMMISWYHGILSNGSGRNILFQSALHFNKNLADDDHSYPSHFLKASPEYNEVDRQCLTFLLKDRQLILNLVTQITEADCRTVIQ